MKKYALFLLLVVLLAGCENKMKPTVVAVSGRLPSQESWNSTVVFSDSGETRGILKAGHLLVFNDENKPYLGDSIRVDFFNDQGQHTSYLTADSGIVDNNTNNLEAIGNVYVHSDSGTSLWTQRLFWNDHTQKVTSNDYVKIVSKKETIEGIGFVSDRDLTNYRIFNVSGEAKTAK